MNFDIQSIMAEMSAAISDSVKDQVGDIRAYARTIVEEEKESLAELGKARIKGDIDDDVFNSEVAREKKVVATQLLTVQLMTEAAAEKAVNAAINVFVNAVKTALKAAI